MNQLQTYNPARLVAAYSPNRPNWPLAVWLTRAIGQSAMAKLPANKLPADRPMHLGARYVPQSVLIEDEVMLEQEALVEEAKLPAMPKRRYQITMRVKQIEKGRLRM